MKISQQCDLPEPIVRRFIGRLESWQIERSILDAVGAARSVVASLWNRLQETGNISRRPEQGQPCTTRATDDRYIELTGSQNRTYSATPLQRLSWKLY